MSNFSTPQPFLATKMAKFHTQFLGFKRGKPPCANANLSKSNLVLTNLQKEPPHGKNSAFSSLLQLFQHPLKTKHHSWRTRAFVLDLAVVLAFCVLYATQAIAPILQEDFHITIAQTSLLMTMMFLPLALSALVYGFVLENFSVQTLLVTAFFALSLLQFLTTFAASFHELLLLRLLSGLFIPAVLISVMSLISRLSPSKELAKNLGFYICVTIFGGLFARFCSSVLSDYLGWRLFFCLIGGALFLCGVALIFVTPKIRISHHKPRLSEFFALLAKSENLRLCTLAFLCFGAYQAILNLLPFEVSKLSGGFDGVRVFLAYVGWVVGMVIGLNITRLITFFGGEKQLMGVGILSCMLALWAMSVASYGVIFAAMFLLCFGFFSFHTTASSLAPRQNPDHRPIASGLYIGFYYAGAAVGCYAPAFLYASEGWQGLLMALCAVFGVAAFLLFGMRR